MLATGGKGVRMAAILRALGPEVIRDPTDLARLRSECTAPALLQLDRFEEGLEVPLAEAPGPVALDDLEEEGRAVLDRLREDLQEVALLITIDEDAQVGELAQVLIDRADAVREQFIIGAPHLEERDVVVAHG